VAESPDRVITVTSSVGTGPTPIAAFDDALQEAGVGNFNLVQLTSVIPTGACIDDLGERPATVEGDWGDRLYVVLAEGRADRSGDQAWAGIGWVQQADTRKGLFAEHSGSSESSVQSSISHTLTAMTDRRPDDFGSIGRRIRGTVCEGAPVCALVVAVFEPQAWGRDWAPPSDLDTRAVSGFGSLYP
jgi:arginine decarboxylase